METTRKTNRGEKAIMSTVTGFLDELVTLVCSLILPRLILKAFGSQYNGLVSSITQFITVIALMKAGIGGVTRVALYKPLAEKNSKEISAIVVQTERFMRKVAMIYVAFVLVVAVAYPLFINREFEFLFSFTLILIISASTFSQYYFGLTYQMVINADQRRYVILIFNMAKTILNTVISVILIKMGFGIHIVKLGGASVFVIAPIILNIYTKRYYHIDTSVTVKEDLIKQRWDAVGHEVANFVHNNTDVMVLTVFTSLSTVSVYTVYHYVITGIKKILLNFVDSFGSAFGNMYALGETELMHKNLNIFELIVFSLSSIIYSTTFVMLTPFVMIYTSGVTDANYFQPLFGTIIALAGAFNCFRVPYHAIVVTAAGHFKETKKGAYLEAVINIVVSILCVVRYGLIGVAIGTLCATAFRTVQYVTYLSRHILYRKVSLFLKHLFIVLGIFGLTYYLSTLYMGQINTVLAWISYAVLTTLISFVLTVVTDLLFYRDDSRALFKKIMAIFRRRAKSISK